MKGFSALLKGMAMILAAALIVGLIIGQVAWALAACLLALLIWHMRQLWLLGMWLQHSEQTPPEARGLWGDVFDSLYHLQRKQQRRRESLLAVIERTQASTSALRDAVVMLDPAGNLEWWNPVTETLLGLKQPQDIGQPITNLIRHPRFKKYFDSGDYQDALNLVSPVQDGLQLQYQLTRYGQGSYLMLARDITRIQQLEQMRKDFVANVSHELRTPLTVIRGYLETLLEQDELNPRWRRAMQQMQGQGERMQHLLDDLLLLAKLEATDYPSSNDLLDIDRLLDSICRDAQLVSGGQHRIQLHAASDLRLKGSESELRSAFSNLIFNAVKYTPAGGEIDIRWEADAQGATLSVTDNGVGIDSRHLPRLTERFYRVDSSRHSSTGGTGLGLAIVKHVLMRHHGQLHISSKPGQGSCFSCHFEPCQLSSDAS